MLYASAATDKKDQVHAFEGPFQHVMKNRATTKTINSSPESINPVYDAKAAKQKRRTGFLAGTRIHMSNSLPCLCGW
jgi:hypothetical protein